MELNIMNAAERSARSNSGVRSDFGEFAANGFQSELETALDSRSGIQQNGTDILGGYSEAFVAVSPKITEKIKNDPEYSAELSQKLNALLKRQGEDLKNCVVIVDRKGDISQHCFYSKEQEDRRPTAEELKAVARARARRKARLDAYFHLLERNSIKRKLIEQENAKRLRDKKYRFSVSGLDIAARSRQLTPPPLDPDYFF